MTKPYKEWTTSEPPPRRTVSSNAFIAGFFNQFKLAESSLQVWILLRKTTTITCLLRMEAFELNPCSIITKTRKLNWLLRWASIRLHDNCYRQCTPHQSLTEPPIIPGQARPKKKCWAPSSGWQVWSSIHRLVIKEICIVVKHNWVKL